MVTPIVIFTLVFSGPLTQVQARDASESIFRKLFHQDKNKPHHTLDEIRGSHQGFDGSRTQKSKELDAVHERHSKELEAMKERHAKELEAMHERQSKETHQKATTEKKSSSKTKSTNEKKTSGSAETLAEKPKNVGYLPHALCFMCHSARTTRLTPGCKSTKDVTMTGEQEQRCTVEDRKCYDVCHSEKDLMELEDSPEKWSKMADLFYQVKFGDMVEEQRQAKEKAEEEELAKQQKSKARSK